MIKFRKNCIMKPKIYFLVCKFEDKNCQPIIIINNNKYTVFSNN